MKLNLLLLPAVAGLSCVLAPSAKAALTLHYNFESLTDLNVDLTVNNEVAAGTDGTISNPGKVQLIQNNVITVGMTRYQLGKGLRFISADGDNAAAAGHVDTGLTADALGMANGTITNRQYTVMAWVNFGSQAGDNMLVGQLEGAGDAVFHLGSRDAA